MDEIDLSPEQQFLIARVGIDAQDLSKQELIEALVAVWTTKLLQQQIYSQVMLEHNIGFVIDEHYPVDLSEPDALKTVFGYEPSEEEASDYLIGLIESSTMELDMEEIISTPED